MVTILPARCLRPAGSRHRSEKLVLYAPLRVASIRFSLASRMQVHTMRASTPGGTGMAIGHAMVTILPARCLRPAGSRHRSEKLVLYAPLRVASIRFSLASRMQVHTMRASTPGGTGMAIGHAMVTILPARCLRPAGSRHRSEKLVLYAPLRVASIRFSLASLMSVHRGSCKHARRARS